MTIALLALACARAPEAGPDGAAVHPARIHLSANGDVYRDGVSIPGLEALEEELFDIASEMPRKRIEGIMSGAEVFVIPDDWLRVAIDPSTPFAFAWPMLRTCMSRPRLCKLLISSGEAPELPVYLDRIYYVNGCSLGSGVPRWHIERGPSGVEHTIRSLEGEVLDPSPLSHSNSSLNAVDFNVGLRVGKDVPWSEVQLAMEILHTETPYPWFPEPIEDD